jgi:hypothetical protein
MNCTVREQVPKEIVALITQQQIPRWRERVHFSAFVKMAKAVRKCKREHGVLLVLHLMLVSGVLIFFFGFLFLG